MNSLIEMSSEMTMSTREIADMLGARHADIIKSVCRLHDAGAICHDTTLPFREFKTERGNTYIEYMLNKLDSITWWPRTVRNSRLRWLSAGMSWSAELPSQASWIA